MKGRITITLYHAQNSIILVSIAAQPIHWVYQGMESVLEGLEHPEFRATSANPFYSIPTGLQSPYGDQLIIMLESLVASKGN